MDNLRSGLFTTFRIFLHGISDDFMEDSFCSGSCLVLHVRIQFPTDPMKDHFLSGKWW